METLEDLLGRAEELLDRGDYRGAEGLLLPEREGGNPEVLYLLGLVCYLLEKHQEAVEHLNRAICLRVDYVLALARRGLAYQVLDQEQEAKADFEQAITIPPQDHKDWRGRGIACYGLKKHEEAITAYDKALEIKPDYYEAWYNRGINFAKLEKYSDAIISFDKALEIKPEYYYAWYGWSFALYALGKYGEAITAYDKALEIKPDDHDAWYNRSRALYELGRYEDAITSYNKALEIKPDNHDAWCGRGSTLQNLGRNAEAIISYDKAIELKSNYHEAWSNRGSSLYALEKYKEAIASCDKALEIKPDYHDAWYNRSRALYELGRYEDAIASCDKALEIKPDYHDAWTVRGVALERSEKYVDAIASYNKAIEIKPDYYYAWYGRGNALYALEKYKEAITSFDKVIEIKPDYHEACYGRGIALYALGRHEEAIASYDRAIEIKPDYHLAWDAWRGLSVNGVLSFQDWLRVQQHCERGLEKITFEKEPRRHLEIWKYYLWVCSRTRSPEQTKTLAYDAGNYLNRYLTENSMSEWEEQRFKERFVMFQQVGVSTLAQAGALEKALELAEEHRNYRLGWLLQGQGYQPRPTTYTQAQQLLNPQTAIIYWHYSPIGLTTFILKHNQPLQILTPPLVPAGGISLGNIRNEATFRQLQDLEKWLQDWKQDYATYGQISPEQPKESHPWQQQMQLRLNSPTKGSGSLKMVLNIKQLVEEHLQNIENLILIPHRDLHLLPLHFLFPFKFTTTYLPSLQIGLNLQTLNQIPLANSCLNLHQPTGDIYIETTKEIIDKLTKTAACPLPSKAEFLELLQTRHGTLQFMGHGRYNPEEPENSYLNLPDEQLLLQELRHYPQLDLSSYRLICLTACESGITTGSLLDEYVGWGGVLLAKQARAVISTLWSVDVRSSAFLIIKFYEIFTTEPQKSAPRILREAQEWLSTLEYKGLADWYDNLAELVNGGCDRDFFRTEASKLRADEEKMQGLDRPFTNPYHWAGFVCTGLLSG